MSERQIHISAFLAIVELHEEWKLPTRTSAQFQAPFVAVAQFL